MKTAGKWMAVVLCLLLLAALPAAALAADAAPACESVAAEFMKLLDSDGTEYYDLGVMDSGAYLLEIWYPRDAGEDYDVFLSIDESGNAFSAAVLNLHAFDGERLSEALQLANELNRRSSFAVFKVSAGEGVFTAECHGVLLGSAARSAGILYQALERMLSAMDRAGEVLAEVFPIPEDIPDPSGTWYFASLTMETAQGEPLTLTAEDMGTDELLILTLREDGTAELEDYGQMVLEGTDTAGTWTQQGNEIRLEMEDTLSLRLEEDTLTFDTSGKLAASVTLYRRAEDPAIDDGKAEKALGRAAECVRYHTYSRSALIEKLTSEGFTGEVAAYAADNCGADWAEQAFLCGKAYLFSSTFSRVGLIGQLEYEGYTTEEATAAADKLFDGVVENGRTVGEDNAIREAKSFVFYTPCSCRFLASVLANIGFTDEEIACALENCGVDWAEQALLCAKKYAPNYSTREELSSRLKLDDFTDEEIAYALDQLGLK